MSGPNRRERRAGQPALLGLILRAIRACLTRLWRMRSFASKVADEMFEVSALQRRRSEVLRRVRIAAGKDMCQLW